MEGLYFGQLKQKHCVLYLQNDLIIQIMTECSEIDNLRKQVDDAKMKLATEIKVLNRHVLVNSVVSFNTLFIYFSLFV